MADVHSPAQRSYNMSRIRSKDTGPEVRLRSLLHRSGLRFRLHGKELPGRPDIVLPAAKVAVFVHGCFWHRHWGCRYSSTPSSNVDFWEQKFGRTVERDQENIQSLGDLGWAVIVAWECQVKGDPGGLVDRIKAAVEHRIGERKPRG